MKNEVWLHKLIPLAFIVVWLTVCSYFFSRQLIDLSLLKVCNELTHYHETDIHKEIKAHKMHMDVFKIVNNTKKFAKYNYKLRQSFIKSIKENRFSHYHILCEKNNNNNEGVRREGKGKGSKEHYFCHSGSNDNKNKKGGPNKNSDYHTISCTLNYPLSLNLYFLNENIHFKHMKCYLMWFNK